MAALKNNIHKWISCDEHLVQLNKQAKEIRAQKDQVEKTILSIIEDNKLQGRKFKLNDINLSYKQTETVAPLTMKIVKETLEKYIKNPQSVDTLIASITDTRNANRKKSISLKKTKVVNGV
jgi:hypothetical protein